MQRSSTVCTHQKLAWVTGLDAMAGGAGRPRVFRNIVEAETTKPSNESTLRTHSFTLHLHSSAPVPISATWQPLPFKMLTVQSTWERSSEK